MANYVKANYKVPTFLALIGADAYGLLRNLLAPELPKDKSFDELKELLVSHYSPKPRSQNVSNFIVGTSLGVKQSQSL